MSPKSSEIVDEDTDERILSMLSSSAGDRLVEGAAQGRRRLSLSAPSPILHNLCPIRALDERTKRTYGSIHLLQR